MKFISNLKYSFLMILRYIILEIKKIEFLFISKKSFMKKISRISIIFSYFSNMIIE